MSWAPGAGALPSAFHYVTGAMAGAIVRVLCLASLAASAGAADAVEPLPLYYFDRPPYVQKVARNGEEGGLTATPAAQAFRAAGLAFRWTLLPTVRQLVQEPRTRVAVQVHQAHLP